MYATDNNGRFPLNPDEANQNDTLLNGCHAEIHKWVEGYTCAPVRKESWSGMDVPRGSRGWSWMTNHAIAAVRAAY